MTLRSSFCLHLLNVINWYWVEITHFLCPRIHLLFPGRPKPDGVHVCDPSFSQYDYVISWALACLGSKGFALPGEYIGSGYVGNKTGLGSTHLQHHEVGGTRGMQCSHFFSWVEFLCVLCVCVCVWFNCTQCVLKLVLSFANLLFLLPVLGQG